ncbi:MAG TPA: DUF1207 domain-containing protein [Planctomycetota bacterium]|nr:DUF1207 domain-containing protein [Planctomycetota bacterium]
MIEAAVVILLSTLPQSPDAEPALLRAQEDSQEPPRLVTDPPSFARDDWNLELFPDRILYKPYLADPRQSRSGSKVQFPIRNRDGNIKIENTLGGYRPLALWTDAQDPDEELQFSIEAAVFSRFDIQEGWDMDAADYRFGFPFVYRRGDLALKVHVWHLTSHLGDEYMSREGRKRDSYHLDEVAFGASLQLDPAWRAYAEIGVGFYTGPATESGRAQAGLEWVGRPWTGRVSPFVAADFQTRNEIGWGWNGAVLAGVLALPRNPGSATFRAFLEYYRGHDQQTQFKSQLEHYLAVGFSADF